MRTAFSETLIRLAETDERVVLLTGDHGYALFDDFRRHRLRQYINAGVAEQNMVGVAAGLARSGFRPFVYGLSAFIPIRVLEQIKLDVAHDSLPVVLFGDGAGFVYSQLGVSHQSTEDIACLRAVPNVRVFSPADRFELQCCIQSAYEQGLPSYIRLGKADRGDVHHAPITLTPGNLIPLIAAPAGSVALIATGSMVKTALSLAKTQFQNVAVWSAPTVKPMNEAQVAEICRHSRALVTLEEHSVIGGLGATIAEFSAELEPRRVLRIGVEDRFSAYCGTYQYLLSEHHLDEASVATKVRNFINAL